MRLTKRRWAVVGVPVALLVASVVAVRLLGGGGGASAAEQPAEILALDAATGAIVWSAHPHVVFVSEGSFGPRGLSVYTQRFGHGCEQLGATITFDGVTGQQTSERKDPPYGRTYTPIWRARAGSVEFNAPFPPDTDDPSQPGVLEATDLASGKRLWTLTLPSGRSFSSSTRLAMSQGIIVGLVIKNQVTQEEEDSPSGYLEGIDAATGTNLWQAELPGLTSQFLLADGQLYTWGLHSLIALDARTGTERWSIDVPVEGVSTTPQGVALSVAAGDGVVVVAGRGKVQAYDATGQPKWTTAVRAGRAYSMLAVGAGKAYIGADGRSAKLACLGD